MIRRKRKLARIGEIRFPRFNHPPRHNHQRQTPLAHISLLASLEPSRKEPNHDDDKPHCKYPSHEKLNASTTHCTLNSIN
mmetsp:Transcript_8693/g.23489  ORF Transcript_8693/g.23489 Transcript_8693/m.23489 type:complete len:80 (+) Transcript_8693:143-382(+)